MSRKFEQANQSWEQQQHRAGRQNYAAKQSTDDIAKEFIDKAWAWCKENYQNKGLSIWIAAAVVIVAAVWFFFGLWLALGLLVVLGIGTYAYRWWFSGGKSLIEQVSELTKAGNKKDAIGLLKQAHHHLMRGSQPDIAKAMSYLDNKDEPEFMRMQKAEPLLKEANIVAKQVLRMETQHIAEALTHFAEMFNQLGEYHHAAPTYQLVCDMLRRLNGEDHPEHVQFLNRFAQRSQAAKAYDKAEELYKRAAEIIKKTAGESADYAIALKSLAACYAASGKGELSKKTSDQSSALLGQNVGENHPLYLQSLMATAVAHQKKKVWGEAEKLFQKVVDTMAETAQQMPPEQVTKEFLAFRATAVLSLGILFKDWAVHGNIDASAKSEKLLKAQPLCELALDILEHPLTVGIPEHTRSLAVLVEVYSGVAKLDGQQKHAAAYVRQARSMQAKISDATKKDHGPESVEYAFALSAQAAWLREHAALLGSASAMKSLLKGEGDDNGDSEDDEDDADAPCDEKGVMEEALALLDSAGETAKKALKGMSNPPYVSFLVARADIFAKEKCFEPPRYGEAEKLLVSALGLVQEATGPHHPEYADKSARLGQLYSKMGGANAGKAEQLLVQAIEICKRCGFPDITVHMRSLAEHYKSTKDYKRATEVKSQASALEAQLKNKDAQQFTSAMRQVHGPAGGGGTSPRRAIAGSGPQKRANPKKAKK
jgi:tetratricopeptide (TPR) repeat protein